MEQTTTIALLGATGQTGRETLRCLLTRSSIKIHIYVRSRSKLLQQFPGIDKDSRVQIFGGAVTDIDNFEKCLEGAQTIICTLGFNDNRPGITVIQDGAKSIVAGLERLRAIASSNKKDWQKPHVILLSSSTWNDRFAAARPWLFHWIVVHAFWYPYADLLQAHKILEGAPTLLKLLLIQPPAIVDDDARGYDFSTESVGGTVTYKDLGAGFAEAATRKEYQELDAVGITSKNDERSGKYGPELFKRMIVGLSGSYIPGFWTVHDYFH